MDSGLERGARIVLKDCMSVKEKETVLIITDTIKRRIGEALFTVSVKLKTEAALVIILPRMWHGEEPPRFVAEAMKYADVVVCPTRFSMTHTSARKRACETGTRIATMPGITEEMFSKGGITANYEELENFTKYIAKRLTKAKIATLIKDTSRLTLDLKGRKAIASTGLIRRPGEGGNLPSGEAYIAPIEGKSHGTITIDGSMAGIGRLKSSIRIVVKDGYVSDIRGKLADTLKKILGPSKEARNIAELGIGTNNKARLTGNILEDEKVYGTVHIAFGNNSTFGGMIKTDIHIDGVIKKPTLYLDGELIIKEGEFRV